LPTANRFWAKDYVWRDGLLLASVTPTNAGTVTPTLTQHFHLDHLGTPRLVTGDSGVQLGLHTYYPFGAELNLGTNEQPYELMKFTGHERDVLGNDPHTLDDMHARYYSGTMGRFLSVDPVFDMKQAVARPQMWNRYSYVTNNPVLKTDPDGRVENVQQPGFTKPLSEAGGWADQPSVSWAFNSEAFLLTLAADEFVIGPAIGKAAGAIGRFVGRFFGKAEEAVETGAKLSRYDDVTTGRSVANRATNVSRGDFAKNLESNGFTKTVSKDAKVTIFQKDGVKYTLRDTAKSTGGPTAEVFKDGKLVAKIRLEIQ
jgi:RHS repeat-associated protein